MFKLRDLKGRSEGDSRVSPRPCSEQSETKGQISLSLSLSVKNANVKVKHGKVKVEIFLRNENIWLTQLKLAELFDIDRSVIIKHLKNIFEVVNYRNL